MTEKNYFFRRLSKMASLRRAVAEHAQSRLGPMMEVAGAGAKVLRVNPVAFSLWFLFPMFLILTSDWIGLLVVFQAATAAIRLRNAPAVKALAAFSSTNEMPNGCEGECRAL